MQLTRATSPREVEKVDRSSWANWDFMNILQIEIVDKSTSRQAWALINQEKNSVINTLKTLNSPYAHGR